MKKIFLLLLVSPFLFTIDDAEILAAIQKFAPYIRLHPKDLSRPSGIEWFLERVALKQRDGKAVKTILEKGKVTVNNLGIRDINFFLDPGKNKQTYKGPPFVNGKCVAPCYANFVEDKNGAKIQYIFFYPYQGPIQILPLINIPLKELKIGIHEGDWEHIDVYVKGKPASYQLEKVFYARHGKGKGDMVKRKKLRLRNDQGGSNKKGTHPVVFSARNSHASYPKNIKFISSDLDVTSNKGKRWKTWEHIVWIGPWDNPNENQEWIQYKGRWGASKEKIIAGKKVYGSSPRGPATKGWYIK